MTLDEVMAALQVGPVRLADLEAARLSSAFAKVAAAVAAVALSGCELAYMPDCDNDCDATGGSDHVAVTPSGSGPEGI